MQQVSVTTGATEGQSASSINPFFPAKSSSLQEIVAPKTSTSRVGLTNINGFSQTAQIGKLGQRVLRSTSSGITEACPPQQVAAKS